MIKNFKYFIVLAVFLLPACASKPADESDSSIPNESDQAVAVNSAAEEDPDEMICRRENVTGTNFRRRVCMTRADRNRERDDSQEEMLERRNARQ